MRFAYPGGFLMFLTVLTFAGFLGALYLQWWLAAGFVVLLLFCHLGLLLQVRAAAWFLIVIYSGACLLVAGLLFVKTSGTPSLSRLIWKLAFNALVIYELRQWLRRQEGLS